jgi:hypothetical protein
MKFKDRIRLSDRSVKKFICPYGYCPVSEVTVHDYDQFKTTTTVPGNFGLKCPYCNSSIQENQSDKQPFKNITTGQCVNVSCTIREVTIEQVDLELPGIPDYSNHGYKPVQIKGFY